MASLEAVWNFLARVLSLAYAVFLENVAPREINGTAISVHPASQGTFRFIDLQLAEEKQYLMSQTILKSVLPIRVLFHGDRVPAVALLLLALYVTDASMNHAHQLWCV